MKIIRQPLIRKDCPVCNLGCKVLGRTRKVDVPLMKVASPVLWTTRSSIDNHSVNISPLLSWVGEPHSGAFALKSSITNSAKIPWINSIISERETSNCSKVILGEMYPQIIEKLSNSMSRQPFFFTISETGVFLLEKYTATSFVQFFFRSVITSPALKNSLSQSW